MVCAVGACVETGHEYACRRRRRTPLACTRKNAATNTALPHPRTCELCIALRRTPVGWTRIQLPQLKRTTAND